MIELDEIFDELEESIENFEKLYQKN